ncbi:CT20-domain-containing protein [Venturia nashicola]|uniref:CT20-domain-containing protein n=1 Tax=Venturia nashicola TaxID=86259 RepID=A0A4Z1PUB6_9PEZI|nr:CT20-domain-containing protein [Venturia nashicola]TLD38499.1 CT20-domain-containing protein [Venturia nashicola]
MPPTRKKARVSQASTPNPKGTAENTPAPTETSPVKPDMMTDPWTDDETIMLFKCMMRWKPTGLHKHLNVAAIANALSSHGFTAEHTRIPGIWAKLHTLYNLEACDERELNYLGIYTHSPSTSPEAEGAEDNEGAWDVNFSLPEDDFGERMWTRRFDNEKGHEILAPSRAQDADSGSWSDRAASSPPAIDGLVTMEDWRLSKSDREGLREMLGQWGDGEDQDEEEDNTSVKDKGKKTAAGKVAQGKLARSTRSTPADEAEEDEDEEEEQTKAKSKRKRRR